MTLASVSYFFSQDLGSACTFTAISFVLWAPSVGGVLACFAVAALHTRKLASLVATAADTHPGDEAAALFFIKEHLLNLEVELGKETRLPNKLFIGPSALLSVLFVCDALWVLYGYSTSVGGADDDDSNTWDETTDALFYSFKALQLLVLIVALFTPAALTNAAVDSVEEATLREFYGSPNASAAVQWIGSAKIGWKLGSIRPGMGTIKTVISTLVSAALITLSRALM